MTWSSRSVFNTRSRWIHRLANCDCALVQSEAHVLSLDQLLSQTLDINAKIKDVIDGEYTGGPGLRRVCNSVQLTPTVHH